MEGLLTFATENGGSLCMALLLILFYSIPAQCICSLWPFRRTHSSRCSGKHARFCEPHDTSSATHATLLPHPPTDTTETSEETEVSEMTDEHSDDDETQVVRPARPLLRPTMKYVADTPPQLLRLAKIPEGPCPTMQCALKLKNKLLRQSFVSCGRSDSSGSQASSRKKARRRSTAVHAMSFSSTPLVPQIPASGRSHRRSTTAPSSPPPMPAQQPTRRVVSLDASARKSLRDTRLLERLSIREP